MVIEDIKWGINFVFFVGDKMFVFFDIEDGDVMSFKVDEEVFDMFMN